MTGPATPGQEGPSVAPPHLPEGWIAQWDGMSRKYYYVQLSNGISQWELPTHPATNGPTPQATPQAHEHPYGTPGSEQPVPPDGDRSLGGNIGNFAMNQLMGGGKKQSHGSNSNPLVGMATSFLGGGKTSSSGHSSSSQAGIGGIVGGLAGSLLGGGKKPNQHSTQQPQQSHGGGFMDSVGGMFGGHTQQQSQQNYGYSQGGNTQQGGYTGTAPPTSYQPSGTAHTQYNAPPTQHAQHAQHNAAPDYSSHNYGQQGGYNAGAPPQHTPSYGSPAPQYNPASPHQPDYHQQQQQQQQHHQQPPPQQYGGYPPQGAPQYGQGPPPPHYGQPGPAQHGQPGPQYGQAPPSGNLTQPSHGQYNHSHSGGLYGNAQHGSPAPAQGHYGGSHY